MSPIKARLPPLPPYICDLTIMNAPFVHEHDKLRNSKSCISTFQIVWRSENLFTNILEQSESNDSFLL